MSSAIKNAMDDLSQAKRLDRTLSKAKAIEGADDVEWEKHRASSISGRVSYPAAKSIANAFAVNEVFTVGKLKERVPSIKDQELTVYSIGTYLNLLSQKGFLDRRKVSKDVGDRVEYRMTYKGLDMLQKQEMARLRMRSV